MPNWCENRVRISGDEEDIKKFVKLVQGKGEEGDFWFKNVIPQPEYVELETGADLSVLPYDASWTSANWGTKTEVGNDIEHWDIHAEEAEWDFYTAWGPPEEICSKLREMFPNIDVSWFFNEPGMEIAGYL